MCSFELTVLVAESLFGFFSWYGYRCVFVCAFNWIYFVNDTSAFLVEFGVLIALYFG